MLSSDIIIAIYKDENTSIFKIAHYGIVDNLHKVILTLIKEIKKIILERGIKAWQFLKIKLNFSQHYQQWAL